MVKYANASFDIEVMSLNNSCSIISLMIDSKSWGGSLGRKTKTKLDTAAIIRVVSPKLLITKKTEKSNCIHKMHNR